MRPAMARNGSIANGGSHTARSLPSGALVSMGAAPGDISVFVAFTNSSSATNPPPVTMMLIRSAFLSLGPAATSTGSASRTWNRFPEGARSQVDGSAPIHIVNS